MLDVAVGIITNEQEQVLIAQRQSHQALAACWEFPGGKINADESAYCALKRELLEEVNVHLESAYPLINQVYHYPHASVHLYFWHVTGFTGEAKGVEGQCVRWVDIDALDAYPFPEGNQAAIRLMQVYRGKGNTLKS